MTDEQAVLRCQNGEHEAFRHLVERYKDVLFGTAVLMTGNRALAEEQVQEALLAAWRGISGFQSGRPVKPWLVRILVNAVVSQRRRRALDTVPLETYSHADDRPSPGETVEAKPRPTGDPRGARWVESGPPAGGRAAVFRGPDGSRTGRSYWRAGGHGQIAAQSSPEPASGTNRIGRCPRGVQPWPVTTDRIRKWNARCASTLKRRRRTFARLKTFGSPLKAEWICSLRGIQ